MEQGLPGNRLGIYVWGKALFAEFPNYQDESIAAFEYEIAAVTPWHDLIIGKQTPQWWEVYNDVKHHRAENKNWCKATQSMVFQALCGLYVAVEYLVAVTFYKDEQEQKNNNEMGRFRSEHLQIANWLPYFSYFNVNDCYVPNASINKRLYEALPKEGNNK